MQALDVSLQRQHAQQGGSFTAFKQGIKASPWCLSHGKQMASAGQLRRHLHANAKCKVSREMAKEFKYVKQCLIRL